MHLPTVDIVRDARQRLTVSQHFEEGEPKPYALFEYVPQVGRSQKFRVELRTVDAVRRLHNWLGAHLLYLVPPTNLADPDKPDGQGN
jgi:hypothetical protein